MTPKPPNQGINIEAGCGIGCLAIVLFIILMTAITGGGDSGGGSSRDDCRSSYEGVGDGTVDWRGICDVK